MAKKDDTGFNRRIYAGSIEVRGGKFALKSNDINSPAPLEKGVYSVLAQIKNPSTLEELAIISFNEVITVQ